MKFADPHLILTASSRLERVFRFGESRSYLACHHTQLLRNLSTFTLRQTLILFLALASQIGFILT
jgi:hypothetical protein